MNWQDIPSKFHSKTDAELAALLPKLTQKAISTSALGMMLRDNDLAWRSAFGGATFVGPLIDFARDAGTPKPIKDGLDLFFGYLMTDATVVNSHDEKYGLKTNQIFNALLAYGQLTQQQVDDFLELGGGLPWKDETEVTIAAARAADQAEQDAAAAYEAFRELYVNCMDVYVGKAEITADKIQLAKAFRDAADWLDTQ